MFQDCEVMFHVATMLPLQPCKAGEQVQQLARKRHIGNDIVVIVFQDGTTPFDVSSVASEFNHVWFVVQPLKMAGKTHYRLAIACKNGVGEFGPPFSQSVFASDAAFRSFLLAKLINAERAAYQAPGFRQADSPLAPNAARRAARNGAQHQQVDRQAATGGWL
jgi:RAP1 GTPase activating protein 1